MVWQVIFCLQRVVISIQLLQKIESKRKFIKIEFICIQCYNNIILTRLCYFNRKKTKVNDEESIMLSDDARKIDPCFKLNSNKNETDSNDTVVDMIVLNNGNKICPILQKKAASQINDALETGKSITGHEHKVTSVTMNDGTMSNISIGVQIKT